MNATPALLRDVRNQSKCAHGESDVHIGTLGPQPLVLLAMAILAVFAAAALYVGAALANENHFPLYLLPALMFLVAFGGACLLWLSAFSERTRVAIFAAGIVSIDFGLPNHQLHSLTFVVKGFCYALLLACSIFALLSDKRNRRVDNLAALFVVYALFSWATVFISYDRVTTAYTGFGLFSLALGGLWLAQGYRENTLTALRTIRDVLATLVAISLVLLPLMPGLVAASDIGNAGRMAGFFGGPNSLGAVAAIGALLTLAGDYDRPIGRDLLSTFLRFAIFFSALSLSGSRTSFVALTVAIGAVLLVRWPGRAIAVTTALITTAAAVVLSIGRDWSSAVLLAISRHGDGKDIATLTGRFPIWERLFDTWLNSPWIGYGLGGSRQLIEDVYITRWGQTFQSAHNAWLESLLNVGIFGTTVLLAIVVGLIWRLLTLALRRTPESVPPAAISAGLLCFILVHGVAEKSFAGTASTPTGALILAIALVSATRDRRQRIDPKASAEDKRLAGGCRGGQFYAR